MESATTCTPSQPCGIVNGIVNGCYAKVATFPIAQHTFSDLGACRDQKGDYIAAGDCHPAVPTTENHFLREGISNFMKGASHLFRLLFSAWQ